MKMKLGEITENYTGLAGMLDRAFPAKLGYAIRKNLRTMETEVKTYNDERLEICKRMATKDEKGEPVMRAFPDGSSGYDIPDDDMENFNREITELRGSETEIDIHMVPESVLEMCDTSERYTALSVRDLLVLEFMTE